MGHMPSCIFRYDLINIIHTVMNKNKISNNWIVFGFFIIAIVLLIVVKLIFF